MSCCNITLYCCLKKMMSTPALFFFFWPLREKKIENKNYFYSIAPTWQACSYPLENNPILSFSFIWWCSQDFWVITRCQVLSWFQVQRCRGPMFIHSRISWEKFPDHQHLFPLLTSGSREAMCFSQRLCISSIPSSCWPSIPSSCWPSRLKDIFLRSGMGWMFLCLVQCMTGRPVAPLLSPNAERCGRPPWNCDWRHAVEHRGSSFYFESVAWRSKSRRGKLWPAPLPQIPQPAVHQPKILLIRFSMGDSKVLRSLPRAGEFPWVQDHQGGHLASRLGKQ